MPHSDAKLNHDGSTLLRRPSRARYTAFTRDRQDAMQAPMIDRSARTLARRVLIVDDELAAPDESTGRYHIYCMKR